MSEKPETMQEAVEKIAFWVMEHASTAKRVLVLIEGADGVNHSMDNGLTVDEAKTLVMDFHSWLDECQGREKERRRLGDGDSHGN